MINSKSEDSFSSYELACQINDYVVGLRRDFHEHPEISLQEERTMQVITEELDKMNIPFEIVPDGGIIGFIEGEQAGKSVILRADIDALPMEEDPRNLQQEKHVVSKYKNAAHTCGHDGHTAMLLGAAKILANHRSKIKGKVILAFEQGEENGAGIQNLLSRLIEIGADASWGIHLKSDIPVGKISVDPGPRMASIYFFNVLIKGKSGHISRPDLAVSAIDCFTAIYQQTQQMRLTKLDPFKPIVFGIGELNAGSASNVVAERLNFQGSFRFLHLEQGERAVKEFKEIIAKTCELHDCTYEFVSEMGPADIAVINDEKCAQIAARSVEKSIGSDALYPFPPWMASDSFGQIQQHFPGVYAFVGIKNDEFGSGAEHHDPQFDIDEDALKLGVAISVEYVIDFLEN